MYSADFLYLEDYQ